MIIENMPLIDMKKKKSPMTQCENAANLHHKKLFFQLKIEEIFSKENFFNSISKIISEKVNTNSCAPKQTTPQFHSISSLISRL